MASASSSASELTKLPPKCPTPLDLSSRLPRPMSFKARLSRSSSGTLLSAAAAADNAAMHTKLELQTSMRLSRDDMDGRMTLFKDGKVGSRLASSQQRQMTQDSAKPPRPTTTFPSWGAKSKTVPSCDVNSNTVYLPAQSSIASCANSKTSSPPQTSVVNDKNKQQGYVAINGSLKESVHNEKQLPHAVSFEQTLQDTAPLDKSQQDSSPVNGSLQNLVTDRKSLEVPASVEDSMRSVPVDNVQKNTVADEEVLQNPAPVDKSHQDCSPFNGSLQDSVTDEKSLQAPASVKDSLRSVPVESVQKDIVVDEKVLQNSAPTNKVMEDPSSITISQQKTFKQSLQNPAPGDKMVQDPSSIAISQQNTFEQVQQNTIEQSLQNPAPANKVVQDLSSVTISQQNIVEKSLQNPALANKVLQDPSSVAISQQSLFEQSLQNPVSADKVVKDSSSVAILQQNIFEQSLQNPAPADKVLEDPSSVAISQQNTFEEIQKNTVEQPLRNPTPAKKALQDPLSVPISQQKTLEQVQQNTVEQSLQNPAPAKKALQDQSSVAISQQGPSKQSLQNTVEQSLQNPVPTNKMVKDSSSTTISKQETFKQVQQNTTERSLQNPAPANKALQDPSSVAISQQDIFEQSLQNPATSPQVNLPNHSVLDLSALADQFSQLVLERTPASAPASTPAVVIDQSIIDLSAACGHDSMLFSVFRYPDCDMQWMADEMAEVSSGVGDASPMRDSKAPKAPKTVVKKKTITDRRYLISAADAWSVESKSETASAAAKKAVVSPTSTSAPPPFDLAECKIAGGDGQLADDSAEKRQLQLEAMLLAKDREIERLSQALEKREYELQLEKRDNAMSKQNVAEMAVVVAEYEKTLDQLMAKREACKCKQVDVDALLAERNRLADDLLSMENSFGDMFKRYDKMRQATEDLRKNEETLKQMVDDYEKKLKRADERFGRLREHSEDKLEKANLEIGRLMKARETDTVGLRAKLKQRDAQVDALQRSVEAKEREIGELTSICDDLIQKAGTNPSNDESVLL